MVKQQHSLSLILETLRPLSPLVSCVGAGGELILGNPRKGWRHSSSSVLGGSYLPALPILSFWRADEPVSALLQRGAAQPSQSPRLGPCLNREIAAEMELRPAFPCLLSPAVEGKRGEGSGGQRSPVPTASLPSSPRTHTPAQPESPAILLLMGLAPLKAVCEGIVCNHSKRNIIQRPFRPQKKRQSRVIIGDSPLTRASLLFVCVGLIRAANGAGGGAH